VLSLNGSAITLSEELWQAGVRDAASLRAHIEKERGRRVYRFGAVLDLSTQNQQLRGWLRAGGIDPDHDVRIQVVPSPVIHRGLTERHLDGYCVAEPWNSIVTQAGAGWVVATSAELDPGLPEKVLLVLEKFEDERPQEHRAMVAALAEASIFCEHPENRAELIAILAQARYLDVPASLLGNSLLGPFDTGHGRREVGDFITYHRHGANIPDLGKGRRVFSQVREMAAAQSSRALRADVVRKVFREDIYREACGERSSLSSVTHASGKLPRSTAPPNHSRLLALAH
jgi:ABC-type nitrate/sulfonate/bicarbonate transport system substrate-binding protein